MRKAKIPLQIFLLLPICCMLCACQTDSAESAMPEIPAMPCEAESIPPLLYQRTTSYDQETGVRRSTLDTQGLPLSVYFEIPFFDEDSASCQKINAFFQNLEEDFYSENNESLLNAWHLAAVIPRESHASEDFLYENHAVIYTSDKLLSVGLYFDWWMGGVNDTGGSCYTFSLDTGELLKLSDLIEETEQEVLNALYRAMEDEGLDLTWRDIQKRRLDDFDFFIVDDKVFIDFDRYEAAAGAGGSITIPLPVSLINLKESDVDGEQSKSVSEGRS